MWREGHLQQEAVFSPFLRDCQQEAYSACTNTQVLTGQRNRSYKLCSYIATYLYHILYMYVVVLSCVS